MTQVIEFMTKNVDNTLTTLKNTKAPDGDGIVNELLKYLGMSLVNQLTIFFHHINDGGKIFKEW